MPVLNLFNAIDGKKVLWVLDSQPFEVDDRDNTLAARCASHDDANMVLQRSRQNILVAIVVGHCSGNRPVWAARAVSRVGGQTRRLCALG